MVEYERAGAAGLHVEDQVFPKRCGHLDGKELVPCEEMCLKVEAMVSAKRDPDFLVIARTDARGVTGMDDAIARANAYRAAGADAIFPEGLQSEAEFEAFAKGSPGLLLANMTEFGKTPFIALDRFGELGYRLVIFPVSLLRLAMGEVVRSLEVLKQTGSFESLVERMQTRSQLYGTLGYEPGKAWRYPQG